MLQSKNLAQLLVQVLVPNELQGNGSSPLAVALVTQDAGELVCLYLAHEDAQLKDDLKLYAIYMMKQPESSSAKKPCELDIDQHTLMLLPVGATGLCVLLVCGQEFPRGMARRRLRAVSERLVDGTKGWRW